MGNKSAGILMYRLKGTVIEVFLVHPGGPFWAKKDKGAWSIPKGEFSEEEDALEAAKREFTEETGIIPMGDFQPLDPVKQPGGKTIYVWIIKGDADSTAVRSNKFSLEWPKGSGRIQEFPEVDRAQWFDLENARYKILKGQSPFLNQLENWLVKD